MNDDRMPEGHYGCLAELIAYEQHAGSREDRVTHHRVSSRYSYEMKLGRETIKLDPVAFRILRFLASRPYRAFTRRRIAEAVSTPLHPVAPETLDRHIARLRYALGFFHDYVQTVPYIGYRFRA